MAIPLGALIDFLDSGGKILSLVEFDEQTPIWVSPLILDGLERLVKGFFALNQNKLVDWVG